MCKSWNNNNYYHKFFKNIFIFLFYVPQDTFYMFHSSSSNYFDIVKQSIFQNYKFCIKKAPKSVDFGLKGCKLNSPNTQKTSKNAKDDGERGLCTRRRDQYEFQTARRCCRVFTLHLLHLALLISDRLTLRTEKPLTQLLTRFFRYIVDYLQNFRVHVIKVKYAQLFLIIKLLLFPFHFDKLLNINR